MKIDTGDLFGQMQSMMTQARSNAVSEGLSLTSFGQKEVSSTNSVNGNFGQLLSDAINNVNGLQANTNELRTRFDMGDRSVSIGDVMIASQKSSIAFDATVQVRNKVVEAYKEIMSMPV
jgi:flagellar hook-basal body complex protein FliE